MSEIPTVNNTDRSARNLFAEWLEKLQQESWQLELVISGLALYLIYEVRTYLDEFSVYSLLHENLNTNIFDYANDLLFGSWLIFIINLIIHILSRGFWIGAIGLRYVSGEVDYKSLKYSEIFETHLEKKVGRFDEFIERLERFCSILYAYTFLLFFIFVSIMAFFGFFILLMNGFEWLLKDMDESEKATYSTLIILPYFIFGLIYAIDAILMGAFKKIKDKTVSRIYFYVYRFFNVITLSFLYRSLVYNFIDNAYSRRFIWFSIPYFLCIFILFPSFGLINLGQFPVKDHCTQCIQENFVNWQFYDDLRKDFLVNNKVKKEKLVIDKISLESYENVGDHMNVFFRMISKDEKYLERVLKIHPRYKTGFITSFQDEWAIDTFENNITEFYTKEKLVFLKLRKNSKDSSVKKKYQLKIDSIENLRRDSLDKYFKNLNRSRIDGFKSLFEIKIDSIPYSDSIVCKWFVHPNMGEKGILCHFPVRAIEDGSHILYVDRKMYYEDKDRRSKITKDTFELNKNEIPFFKYSKTTFNK